MTIDSSSVYSEPVTRYVDSKKCFGKNDYREWVQTKLPKMVQYVIVVDSSTARQMIIVKLTFLARHL